MFWTISIRTVTVCQLVVSHLTLFWSPENFHTCTDRKKMHHIYSVDSYLHLWTSCPLSQTRLSVLGSTIVLSDPIWTLFLHWNYRTARSTFHESITFLISTPTNFQTFVIFKDTASLTFSIYFYSCLSVLQTIFIIVLFRMKCILISEPKHNYIISIPILAMIVMEITSIQENEHCCL